jgi:hypothetical protein
LRSCGKNVNRSPVTADGLRPGTTLTLGPPLKRSARALFREVAYVK